MSKTAPSTACTQKTTTGLSTASSVWGSAGAHFTEFGDRRFLLDAATSSMPETKVSLKLDNHSDMLVGSRNVVCSTEAEFKANKLNRSEQAKLQSMQSRMTKEKDLFQRRFRQTQKVFRAKSAKIMNRSRSLDPGAATSARPSSLYSNWKPQSVTTAKSEKSFATNNNNNINGFQQQPQQPCELCARIQEVIRAVQLDGQRKVAFEDMPANNQSTCLFSDDEARALLEILESEFLSEAPGLRLKIRDSGLFSHMERKGTYFKRSREATDYQETTRTLQTRIRQFCSEMDRYNKEHGTISKEVQEALERVRLTDAIAKRERPKLAREHSSRSRMRQEVREKLAVDI